MKCALVWLGFAVSLKAQVPFHTPAAPSSEAARKSHAPDAGARPAAEAKRVDWRFLDRTDVDASDGLKDKAKRAH